MTYAAVPIPAGRWGVDVDAPMTDAMLDAVLSADLHALGVAGAQPGDKVSVIVRYVGLAGPARGDITLPELQRILARPEKPTLLLVQHVEAGSWIADGPTGKLHGQNAAADAKAAGYDASLYSGLSLIVDMESLKNPGPAALLYTQQWLAATTALLFGKGVYKGFDDGVTGQQLLELLCPLWAAVGQVTSNPLPGGATFAALQKPTIKIAAVEYDPDQFFLDSRGYAFVGLQDVDYVADIDDTDPAIHIDLPPEPHV